MGKGIVYRYVSKKTGKPLRRCFECGGDLTDPVREGVLVRCVDAGESRPFDSVLLAGGPRGLREQPRVPVIGWRRMVVF